MAHSLLQLQRPMFLLLVTTPSPKIKKADVFTHSAVNSFLKLRSC